MKRLTLLTLLLLATPDRHHDTVGAPARSSDPLAGSGQEVATHG